MTYPITQAASSATSFYNYEDTSWTGSHESIDTNTEGHLAQLEATVAYIIKKSLQMNDGRESIERRRYTKSL
jgi:hypothetical protein